MARALSVDLRRRVVRAIEEGASCRQAAARFWGKRFKRDPLACAVTHRR